MTLLYYAVDSGSYKINFKIKNYYNINYNESTPPSEFFPAKITHTYIICSR